MQDLVTELFAYIAFGGEDAFVRDFDLILLTLLLLGQRSPPPMLETNHAISCEIKSLKSYHERPSHFARNPSIRFQASSVDSNT